MKIKYFQPLADIQKRYNDFFMQKKFFNEKYTESSEAEINMMLSGNYELVETPQEIIDEEYFAITYLINLQYGVLHPLKYYPDIKYLKKPSIEVMNRVFHRHLNFLNENLGCNEQNYKTYDLKIVQKEYLACKHYLFKFSLPAWYEKLPNKITLINFDEDEELLPIPKL